MAAARATLRALTRFRALARFRMHTGFRALAGLCALAGLGALAACGGPAPSSAAQPAAHPAAPSTIKAAASATPSVPPVRASPSQLPPQPRVSITRVRTRDGAQVTVAVFRGPVRYVLHDGSGDPGPVRGLHAGPAVTGTERTQLLAAFNGGFKLSAGVGGYMQEGHVISPLRPGFASLVIDRSGPGQDRGLGPRGACGG